MGEKKDEAWNGVGLASGGVHRQVKSLCVTGGRETEQTNKQTNSQTLTQSRGECPTAATDVNGPLSGMASALTAATLHRAAVSSSVCQNSCNETN